MKADAEGWARCRDNKRETETRGGNESRKRDRSGRREWECSLCLVVTTRLYIQPSGRLIGLRRVRWVEGEGGASTRTERRGRGRVGGKRGVMGCKGCRGSPGKMGRLLTSHSDTGEMRGESSPWDVFSISKMAAPHWDLTSASSFTLLREKNPIALSSYMRCMIMWMTIITNNINDTYTCKGEWLRGTTLNQFKQSLTYISKCWLILQHSFITLKG